MLTLSVKTLEMEKENDQKPAFNSLLADYNQYITEKLSKEIKPDENIKTLQKKQNEEKKKKIKSEMNSTTSIFFLLNVFCILCHCKFQDENRGYLSEIKRKEISIFL